jgi:hypothetical protein
MAGNSSRTVMRSGSSAMIAMDHTRADWIPGAFDSSFMVTGRLIGGLRF